GGIESHDDVDAVALVRGHARDALRAGQGDDHQQRAQALQNEWQTGEARAQRQLRRHQRQRGEREGAEAALAIGDEHGDAGDDHDRQREPERRAEARHAASSSTGSGASSSARSANAAKFAGNAPQGENFSRSPWRRMAATVWCGTGTPACAGTDKSVCATPSLSRTSRVVSSMPRFGSTAARYSRVASANCAHRRWPRTSSRRAMTFVRKRTSAGMGGSTTFAAAARRSRMITAVQAPTARSAAMPMSMNGSRGYASFRGGFSGAGFRSSRGLSTERTGTTMLRKTTLPTRPLMTNGRGSKVRITT